MCARSAFCVSRRYWTSAPAALTAASWPSSPKPNRLCVCSWASSARRAASLSNVHGSTVVTDAASRKRLDHRRGVGETGRRDDLARTQHRQLVEQRLARVGSGVFGGRELAGRQIEQRRTVARTRRDRRDRHQERRFARVEVAGIGQRAGRDHAHDFAADESLGLLRDPPSARRWRRGSPSAPAAPRRRRRRDTGRRTSEWRRRWRPSPAT